MPNRWEAETNSVIVFTDQRESLISGNTEVLVIRDLSNSSIPKDDLLYHPYLVAEAITADGISNVGYGRTEIHIPGDAITSKGKTLTADEAATNYYVSQYISSDKEFPYAMSLSGVSGWVAPESGIRIDKTFKMFKMWTNANGYNYQGWYKNEKGNDYRYASGKYNANATPGVW